MKNDDAMVTKGDLKESIKSLLEGLNDIMGRGTTVTDVWSSRTDVRDLFERDFSFQSK